MAALLCGLALTPPAAIAEDQPFNPEEIEAIESVVRDYIREHPEAVGEALNKLVEQQRAEEEERRRLNIAALGKQLNHDPGSPIAGNENGDVTLVEFFDYNCPYCKAVSRDLQKLIDEDDNLRFVFKEFPILGSASTYAARAALASHKQGKYVDFHFALMAVRGKLSKDLVMKVAKDVGLDVERLQSDMAAAEIDAILAENHKLAQGLQINGTPAFVIGEQLIPGRIGLAELKSLIEDEREG